MSMRARFLWVFIVALAIAALSATTALAMPGIGDLSWDIFGSSLSFAGYLLGAMLSAIVLERRRFRVLMFLSIAGYAAGCLLVWGLIWYPFRSLGMWESQEIIGKIAVSVSLASAVATVVGLLRLLKTEWGLVRLARVTTETCSGAFAALSILILWEVFETWWLFPSEITMRVWSGLLILSIAGLLGTPALRAVEIARRRDAAESGLPMRITVRLTCPRCEHSQSMNTGGAVCVACGLSINVQVEEPQCSVCGYSLAKLDASACPECGTDIHHKG